MKEIGVNKFASLFTGAIMVLSTILLFSYCTPKVQSPVDTTSLVNTSHLDALYEEKKVGGKDVGIIHIYAEYPDYHWVGDQDEGIACVDDASRAAVFYLRQYKVTSSAEHLHKATMLLKFLLQMQAPNGYYYNFIWPDGSINMKGSTSEAVPIWWSWRTLWTFGEGIRILSPQDPLVSEINRQRNILLKSLLHEKIFFSAKTDTAGGLVIPAWLPKGAATDQASIILLGLSLAYQQNVFGDNLIRRDSMVLLMNHLADGVMMMQIEAPGNFCDGAFMSWNNLWHAYANLQSYALLTTGQVLHDPHMASHALYEINTFYPSLYSRGFLQSFWVQASKGKTTEYDAKVFPQIAYGIRPMIFACQKAFEVTGDNTYKVRARLLANWFSGQNPAHVKMYDPSTGLGFDGISDQDHFNRNSGAESTIESLLSMQAIESLDK